MTKTNQNLWAVVLAAGEGTRLRSMTTNERGVAVPKQFCSFQGEGERSMLRSALSRAERLVPKKKILTVVSSEHQAWWLPELSSYPTENILIQPQDRGTAIGVLLPLIEIMRRDTHCQILVLPSDHYVENEEVMQKTLEKAVEASQWKHRQIVLLGMAPEESDPEFGWIIPASKVHGEIDKVKAFVEKPSSSVANRLLNLGGLLNSFMFIAPESLLFNLYLEILPDLVRGFLPRLSDTQPIWDAGQLKKLYETLPTLDFSRDLLEKSIRHLAVLKTPACGWSDLGTPDRVTQCLKKKKRIPTGRPLHLPEERSAD